MDIVFKENYFDEEAEASEDGSKQVFTAGKLYPVSESFGKDMVGLELATQLDEFVDTNTVNLKRKKRR